MKTLTLQINDMGGWRDVASFTEESVTRIKIASVPLAQALPLASWRIVTLRRERTLWTLSGPHFLWLPGVERPDPSAPRASRLPSSRRRL